MSPGSRRSGARAEREAEKKARRSARTSTRTSTRTRTRSSAAVGSSAVYDAAAFEQGATRTSPRLGEMRRAEREARVRADARKFLIRLFLIAILVAGLGVGGVALYNSDVFQIEHVNIVGVEHLTSEEMTLMADVPAGTTLLRVDTETIKARLIQNAWVQDVRVNRVFPDTLEIDVTERSIKAVVEVPAGRGGKVKSWAISEDHIWLMPIPDADSDAAKTTSQKVYEDAESALHITDVPYGTKAEIGAVCTDNNVNNALDILSGMTTDLADRVVSVSAAGPAETTLMLDNGVEIAFGKAEDIRDKERIILKILEDNPDGVAYINVRIVESPTWRSI